MLPLEQSQWYFAPLIDNEIVNSASQVGNPLITSAAKKPETGLLAL